MGKKEKQIHLTHLKDFDLDKVFLKDEMIKFTTKLSNTTLAPGTYYIGTKM